jgi:hypothetical protein
LDKGEMHQAKNKYIKPGTLSINIKLRTPMARRTDAKKEKMIICIFMPLI